MKRKLLTATLAAMMVAWFLVACGEDISYATKAKQISDSHWDYWEFYEMNCIVLDGNIYTTDSRGNQDKWDNNLGLEENTHGIVRIASNGTSDIYDDVITGLVRETYYSCYVDEYWCVVEDGNVHLPLR